MKKTFIYNIILFVLASCLFINNVSAIDRNDIINNISTGRSVLLCEYANDGGTVQNEIYYMFTPFNITNYDPWTITYLPESGNLIVGDEMSGTFSYVFTKSSRVSYDSYKKHMNVSDESTFTCPKYSFIDYTRFDEVCFGKDRTCGTNFENGPFSLSNNTNTIFSKIDEYIERDYSKISFEEWKRTGDGNDINGLLEAKVFEDINFIYSFGTKYERPDFVTNYIKNNVIKEDKLADLQTKMQEETDKAIEAGKLTEEEIEEVTKKNKQTYAELVGSPIGVLPVEPSEETDCNGVLGEQMTEIVNNAFKTIQYAGPILVVVLTAIDLLNAALSGEQEKMKKATDKFTKRLIAAIILFFVPLVCRVIFDVVGITVPDSCIARVK